ncbi:MAG TPA: M56 family metallopeptidase [Thermoanaerobaculia bacterium]|nr:M56 family metallopeptidase [Thermoanaerobaculia bacterium]HUM30739.1 M56 family metallopeptidase [Thermoanaerobaculia bacterium]HXK68972.1 M56 family metallopeptidase [Thermoanaerobaculia bacterium]
MTDWIEIPASMIGAIASSIPMALVMVAAVAILIRLHGRLRASSRYCIWWLTLVAVLALPLVRGTLPPIPEPHSSFTESAPASSAAGPEEPGLDLHSRNTSPPIEFTLAEMATSPSILWQSITLQFQNFRREALTFLLPSIPLSTITGILGGFWMVLAGLLLWRLARKTRAVMRLKTSGTPLRESIQTWLTSLLDRLGSRRNAQVLTHDSVHTPSTVGYLHPAILLPENMVPSLEEGEMQQILMHEAAHLSRYDDWFHLVERILTTLFFFHPALHFLIRKLRFERELACDERVVEATGSPEGYARCLLRVAEATISGPGGIPAPAIFTTSSQMYRRITMIMNPRQRSSRWVAFLATAAISVFLGFSLIQCASTPQSAYAADLSTNSMNAPANPEAPASPAPTPLAAPAPQAKPKPAPHVRPAPPAPPASAATPEKEELDQIVDLSEIHRIVEEAMKHADMKDLDEEEIERIAAEAERHAEKAMALAEEHLHKAEEVLKHHEEELKKHEQEISRHVEAITDEEIEELERKIEAMSSEIEKKVEKRLEGVDWDNLNEAERQKMAQERLAGLEEEIKEMKEKLEPLTKELQFRIQARIKPEIEKALKEIQQAQEEIKEKKKK